MVSRQVLKRIYASVAVGVGKSKKKNLSREQDDWIHVFGVIELC